MGDYGYETDNFVLYLEVWVTGYETDTFVLYLDVWATMVMRLCFCI